jgi:type IV pilus assembly protein PilX
MKPAKTRFLPGGNAQSGAALIVSLLVLTVVTVIGVSGMQATSLEERMAGNMRDRNLAFEAAEAALQAGEDSLNPAATLPSFNSSGDNGFYSTGASPDWYAVWTDTTKVSTYSSVTLAKVHSSPAFIIEQLAFVSGGGGGGSLEGGVPPPAAGAPNTWYRVTARGTGGTDNSEVILQSVYRR